MKGHNPSMEEKVNAKGRTEKELVIKQGLDDSRLQGLLKEYELLMNHQEGVDSRFIQIIAGILAFLGITLGYFLNQQIQPSVELAWVIPLFFIVVGMFLNFLLYMDNANLWNTRILLSRINKLLHEKALISYDAQIPGAIFLSPKRGNPKSKLMFITLFCGVLFMFLLVTLVSLRIVYNKSHLQGFLFVLIYVCLIGILFYVSSGHLSDLPNSYRDFLDSFPKAESIPPDFKFKPSSSVASNLKDAFDWIIPRFQDLLAKGVYFIFGFLSAFIVVGFSSRHLLIINFLFRSSDTDWKSISSVPIWTFWALGALYFVVEEILLQQAKFMWDDIRDAEHDKILLDNSKRPIARGKMSKGSAILHMLVRWFLALLCGYLLGGFALLLVFLLISFHQMIYSLWAKPRAARHPLLPLFIVSFNYPLRFLAGLVAVAGSQWSLSPFVLLLGSFYFYPLGGIALQWKIEAEYQRDINQSIAVRPQSEFYLKNGSFWQYVGLVGAILISGLIVLIHLYSTSCNTTPSFLQRWYIEHCPVNGAVNFVDLGLLNSVILTLGLIAIFMLITMSLVSLFSKTSIFAVLDIRKIKGWVILILFLIYVAVLYVSIVWGNLSFLLLDFLILSVLLLIVYEGMTYPQYKFINLQERFPLVLVAWYAYLFRPVPGLKLKELLAITFTDIDVAKLRSMLPKKDTT